MDDNFVNNIVLQPPWLPVKIFFQANVCSGWGRVFLQTATLTLTRPIKKGGQRATFFCPCHHRVQSMTASYNQMMVIN
jgi:hypothetical protein